MGTNKTFQEKEKELQTLAVKLREEGDLINRYVSHEEVFTVAKEDPELLKHQFIQTENRGLVRNHTKSINKCLGIAKTMLPASRTLVEQLEDAVRFLKEHKPAVGRKSKKITVGTEKTVSLNKRQGYALVPNVGVFFNMNKSSEGDWSDCKCTIKYTENNEIIITPVKSYNLLEDGDDMDAFNKDFQ